MENSDKFYSYQKVIVFGAQETGKTTLIKKFKGEILTEDIYKTEYDYRNESKFNSF